MVDPIVVLDTDTDETSLDMDEDSEEPTFGDIPAQDSMSDIESHLSELYEKASELGIDEKDLLRMSEDEVATLLAEKEEEETTEEEKIVEPHPTAETPTPTSSESQVPTVDYEKRYNELSGLQARQAQELGETRPWAQIGQQLKPLYDKVVMYPELQRMIVEYNGSAPSTTQQEPEFDPLDPASVDRLVASRINKAFQDREAQARGAAAAHQQQAITGNFTNGLIRARAKLIAEGNDPAEVDAVILEFSGKINRGDFVQDALKVKKMDILLVEAETRGKKMGEEEAVKKFKGASSQPVRTISASGRGSGKTAKAAPGSLSDVSSPEEMNAFMDTLPVGSPVWEKAMRTARKQGWV